MILPPIQRISREDVKGSPEWVNQLLTPLNIFLDTIYGGLNKGLTIRENLLSQIETVEVNAGATAVSNAKQFLLKMKAKPQHVIPLSYQVKGAADLTTGCGLSMTWNCDGTNVNITSISGLTNGLVYSVTVLLI